MAVDVMKDPNGPLWLAATVDNAIPDVWGSAYLARAGVSLLTSRPLKAGYYNYQIGAAQGGRSGVYT